MQIVMAPMLGGHSMHASVAFPQLLPVLMSSVARSSKTEWHRAFVMCKRTELALRLLGTLRALSSYCQLLSDSTNNWGQLTCAVAGNALKPLSILVSNSSN